MSTNVVDERQGTTRRYTVAELLARERATAAAGVRQDAGSASQASLPVAELLRREGIEFAGDSAPTDRFEAVAPAAPAALRKQPVAQRERRSGLGRTSTMSRAVVLFGLTVAGLVALKPTVASSPVGDAPHDSDRTMAAPRGAQPGMSTEFTRTGGGATPTTTAASVLLNDTTDVASPMRQSGGSDNGGAPAEQAKPESAGSSTPDGGRADTSSPAPAPAAPVTTQAPRTDSTSKTSEPSATKDSGSGSGSTDGTSDEQSEGGLLDPVTGTVKGVLELGGGLLGG
ncbi:hypothetical protein [Amycolatopsis palatopharyngis]|uniref:hypothetical protein n=1 Tax=Amycolatopsis palatopharyngis TaxID=187982 RepID=UPI000E282B2E|nr:hypothetical protein [Amycolatopsis palatopharyngis]